MGVRIIKLRVVVGIHPCKINDVSHMVAELRARQSIRRELRNHLFGNIVLKLAVLNTSRIPQYMKHHFFRNLNIVGNRRKGISQEKTKGRQAERAWQRLETGVTVADHT